MSSDETPSTKAEWQADRAKHRCTRGARYVTGADIVRISRTLAVESWHFTQTAPAAADDPTSIVVDVGRRRVSLKLANAAQGCVFMLQTANGSGLCGLGDLAPLSCRVFPTDPMRPRVQADDGGCRCAGGENDCHDEQHQQAEALREWAADRDHWYELVARWNAMAAKSNAPMTIEDFQRYLLEAQIAREAGAPWPEEVVA